MIDEEGFRHGVGIVLMNDDNRLFWARRIGSRDAWQFPQGGLKKNESFDEAMYRELREEIGLLPDDVSVLHSTTDLMTYYLPPKLVRRNMQPLCIGQKQKWYLLRLTTDEERVHFNETDMPEFDSFRWVSYWFPVKRIISFKREVYRQVLQEFVPVVFDESKE